MGKLIRKIKTTTTTKTVKVVKVYKDNGKNKSKTPLTFGKGNAKLEGVYTFSLPAGHTCPGASLCLSRAARDTGKIADGKGTQFRCFSASQEAQYPIVRDSRWSNLETLKGKSRAAMATTILDSLPSAKKPTPQAEKRGFSAVVRIHVSGDFFSRDYFGAWCDVATARPDVLFYAYTKSIDTWDAMADAVPANLVLTASVGGKHDSLIGGKKSARVVFSEAEAVALGLPIDHDDSHAMNADGGSFALLLHGSQPGGTAASKALVALRASGDYGYGAKADARRLALPTVN